MDRLPTQEDTNKIKDLAYSYWKQRTNKQALADRFIQNQVGRMDNNIFEELGIDEI